MAPTTPPTRASGKSRKDAAATRLPTPRTSAATPRPKPKPTASAPSPKPTQSTGTAACSSSQGGKQVAAQLVDVRVGRHDTYDRVTFEFSGPGIPSYQIRTDANPTEDGSGLPL